MYFAQGIPQGLLAIAIPAWLASEGASAGDISSYLAVIVLPWAFKLISGPFMDRYEFLAMGRRRPWVLGAQLGLTLALFSLMLIERPAEQIGLLMLLGMFINIFAATQDVAVDGMSIDLTPVREQGRLNAFMGFGKAIGWATSAAVSGMLLATGGIRMAAIVAAAGSGIVLLVFALILEREGERRLPWSRGEAGSLHTPGNSFKAVFGGLNNVLWKGASIVVLLIMFFDGMISGYGHALMPIAAVKLFNYTTAQWSQLVAAMGLIGAVLALGIGPFIDRFGSKRMLVLTIALLGLHALLLAQTQNLWADSLYVKVMLSLWVVLGPVTMVCAIALAMTICSSGVSATQFAIYMSAANLGSSAGSKVFGMIADGTNFSETYTIMSVIVAVTVIVLLFHRDAGLKSGAKKLHTVPVAGAGAGMFVSGAMRCPKCRARMQLLDYDGIEIDRCVYCEGIWFDAGESEALRHKEAAAEIDTGAARDGRQTNKFDNYECPRCSGNMMRVVDPKQTHIWFEKCESCDGSFFDAGEFKDLAEHSIADIFKGFVAPRRKV
jgi:PAT family beta-lactamase induction signal transducer AmpG